MGRPIVRNPNIMHSKPTIAGTRITVELILNLLECGSTIDDIVEDYPYLTRTGVRAAIRVAAKAMGPSEESRRQVASIRFAKTVVLPLPFPLKRQRTAQAVVWKHGKSWLGHLERCPDRVNQGGTIAELRENPAEAYRNLTGRKARGRRHLTRVQVD